MSNSGFVDVRTAPATAAPVRFADLGKFAALAGPTIAPDGTVLLGTTEGMVIALHPDGRPFWNRQLPHPQWILTSPVVGADGSVYVVGSWVARDHRGGTTKTIGYAELHRFTPGGGVPPMSSMPFPEFGNGPTSIGEPRVWRFGSDEAIIVPATYHGIGAPELHLLAFSLDGDVVGDWSETLTSGDVEGAGWEALANSIGLGGFVPGTFPLLANPPVPGAALSDNPQGGTPFVVLIDRYFRRTITFTLCVGPSCPAPGFTEQLRKSHGSHTLWSSGVVALDINQAVVGTDDGVVFGGPSVVDLPPVTGLGDVYATPTRTADGAIVAVKGGSGGVATLRGGAIAFETPLEGWTVARAAASRTHVYIATTTGLHTLNADASEQVATFPLEGGGAWSPAIGPEAHIYVLAANTLHIFPPLIQLPRRPRGQGIGQPESDPTTS